MTENITLSSLSDFLSKMAENSDDVYWLSSPNFKEIVYISPAYEKIWQRPRQLLYDNPELWITYLHPDDVKGFHPIHEMRQKIADLGAQARYTQNYRIIRPDGEIRWIVDRGFPVYDTEGHCCGVTGVAIDITQEKKQETLKQEMEIECAERKSKFMTVLAGSIAHELRTPLLTLQLNLENFAASPIIEKGSTELKGAVGSFCEAIHESLVATNTLINRILLELKSISQGKCDKESFSEISIQKNIDYLLNKYPFTGNQKQLLQGVFLPFSFSYYGDFMLTNHVFFNLMKNALEAISRASKGTICLSFQESENYHKVIFEDTGAGIHPAFIPDLFEQFKTPHGQQGGTGLGLAFCKLIMESYGGKIECFSQPGEYTQFVLSFPKLTIV